MPLNHGTWWSMKFSIPIETLYKYFSNSWALKMNDWTKQNLSHLSWPLTSRLASWFWKATTCFSFHSPPNMETSFFTHPVYIHTKTETHVRTVHIPFYKRLTAMPLKREFEVEGEVAFFSAKRWDRRNRAVLIESSTPCHGAQVVGSYQVSNPLRLTVLTSKSADWTTLTTRSLRLLPLWQLLTKKFVLKWGLKAPFCWSNFNADSIHNILILKQRI